MPIGTPRAIDTDVQKICILGAGAVGGWVAARLALAGSGEVMALSSRGPLPELRVSEGGRTEQARLATFDSTADLLLVAVKAPVLPAAVHAAGRLIGADTLIVPMLNGVPWWFTPEPLTSVDPGRRIATALPIDQVIGCVVHAACRRTGPDAVEVAHADKLILGEPAGGESERVAELCRLFESAGIRSEQSADVRRAIWYKLWGNATINPLSALTRATADRLLADPVLRAFMADAMDELAAVGATVGCAISESAEERMAVTARLGVFKPSMLQDVEAGRPIELEALVGAPIETARRSGIATPNLDKIYAMTRLMGDNLGLL